MHVVAHVKQGCRPSWVTVSPNSLCMSCMLHQMLLVVHCSWLLRHRAHCSQPRAAADFEGMQTSALDLSACVGQPHVQVGRPHFSSVTFDLHIRLVISWRHIWHAWKCAEVDYATASGPLRLTVCLVRDAATVPKGNKTHQMSATLSHDAHSGCFNLENATWRVLTRMCCTGTVQH